MLQEKRDMYRERIRLGYYEMDHIKVKIAEAVSGKEFKGYIRTTGRKHRRLYLSQQ